MEKDKRLIEASCWERLTEGETGSCSDGQASLITSVGKDSAFNVGDPVSIPESEDPLEKG